MELLFGEKEASRVRALGKLRVDEENEKRNVAGKIIRPQAKRGCVIGGRGEKGKAGWANWPREWSFGGMQSRMAKPLKRAELKESS